MQPSVNEPFLHERLRCGVEWVALPIPGRRIVSYEIRVFAGMANEPTNRLGLARIVEEVIDEGTEKHTAQQLTDAFDAIGAQHGSATGRESITFYCTCLPEHLDAALALHAEMLRTPTFPDDARRVAVELAHQELTVLEDDPGELARKLIAPHALGPMLGRHELGTRESLAAVTGDDVSRFWKQFFTASRMQIAIAGAFDADKVAKRVDQLFTGFGAANGDGRAPVPAQFAPGTRHQSKELEQQHILICWPGVTATDDNDATERLAMIVLGGGMSSRLFTEVREKQGLVYWVGAWRDQPRGTGRLYMGASTTPIRCDQTAKTLLREVDRLAEDLTEEELERAKHGVIAKRQTHGDVTRSKTRDLSRDLLHHGRPLSSQEKDEKIRRVTVADVRRYLASHPRDRLCIQTLGPRELDVNLLGAKE